MIGVLITSKSDLKKQLDKIDAQISELQTQRSNISHKYREAVQQEAKKNIGRCFVVNGKMCKIIEEPKEKWDPWMHPSFDENCYTALYISRDPEDVIPFYVDDLRVSASCTEVSPETFETKFDEKLREFKKRCSSYDFKSSDN